jgi:Protein of unknown function (DUF1403)
MDSDTDTLPEHTSSTPRRRGVVREAAPSVAVPNPLTLQSLPRWIISAQASATAAGQGTSPPDIQAAFAAGAASFAVDQITRADPPWIGCLSMRQALKAAEVVAKLLRLNADEAHLRDAEHLTRPGDDPGPAGRLHRLIRQLALRPTRLADETLSAIASEIEGAASSAEVLALLNADVALAKRLGWKRPLLLHMTVILDPALRQGAGGKRPQVDGPDWVNLQHMVLAHAAVAAHAQAVTLSRKAEGLTVAANSLRTRDGGRGLALIVADDSVAPWRMAGKQGSYIAGLGSDRAARRLCESLHGMGALRLLTDRPTFRLYGL